MTIEKIILLAKAYKACEVGIKHAESFNSYEELVKDGCRNFIFWIKRNLPDLFYDIKKHHSDENGNLFCVDCVDCVGCLECVDCLECVGCVDCVRCEGCVDCVGCVRCVHCEGCVDCEGCLDSKCKK